MKVVVVGAGIVGLATAWRLAASGCEVTVVEQFGAGHARGSSHGSTRITRTTYNHPTWVQLATIAHAVDWPELEREAGRVLLHRGGDAVVWGPEDGRIVDYAAACVGSDVESLPVREARVRFPTMRFPDAERVLWDRTAAVVAAADTLDALRQVGARRGVISREHTRVTGYTATAAGVEVDLGGERLGADAVVLAQGPWAPAGWGLRGTPVRQDVGYWALPGAVAGAFPCWIHLGGDGVRRRSHYGLPGIGEAVMKAALHRTADEDRGDDPDVPRLEADSAALEATEAQLREWFHGLGPRLRGETCFYTNTPTEDFVLDVLPGPARVVVGGGLSGHGFKFGPLLGRILADLVVGGDCQVAPFAADRLRFRVPPGAPSPRPGARAG